MKSFILVLWLWGAQPFTVATYASDMECQLQGRNWMAAIEKRGGRGLSHGGYVCIER